MKYTYKQELWRIIPEFPQYLASNHGNIMSLPTISKKISTHHKHSNQRAGRILKSRVVPKGGHLQVYLAHGYNKWKYVHQLVSMAWIKRKNPKCNVVMHLDDNPKNNNVTNLRWGTQHENVKWIYKDEEFGKIDNKPKKIYDLSKILQTKCDYGVRRSLEVLAKKYNRSFTTMWKYYAEEKNK